jgi:hypothetical protein
MNAVGLLSARIHRFLYQGRMNKPQLLEQIAIRLTVADRARLDKLAERYPFATAHALAREALLLGLLALEKSLPPASKAAK